MILTGWGLSFMKNWEYTVLSRVKTREGLFLLEPLDPSKHTVPKSNSEDSSNVSRE
jgi:hypothetical protein